MDIEADARTAASASSPELEEKALDENKARRH
jgi:hypothetical protein